MTERDVISNSIAGPVIQDRLVCDLTQLGVTDGMTLLVHSSLSSIGWVAGGPVAVVNALLSALGPKGTLVMPTHSGGLTDPAGWSNPPVDPTWWPTIRRTMPAFDRSLPHGVWAQSLSAFEARTAWCAATTPTFHLLLPVQELTL